ncbi:histidine phosphatase family protein [Deinococcus sp. HMF7604]|uniref:histidine phosphatase family protein n=1 Tax=Deinococcus betulae TaxID=2873312 RepID=UPI001CC99AB4|nr:histidine phosphatase family protein [Deinococcus betulae]
MTLRLHLVRHAPTARNREGRYPLAHDDAPLSAAGEALARSLKLRGAVNEGATVFASPRLRARQTAALAGFPHAAPAPELTEAQFGVMAGLTWAELEARHGSAPRTWIEALADPDSGSGPPGGETGRAFHARVRHWLDALPSSGEVLAFAHAGSLQAALRVTLGLNAVVTPPGTRVTLDRGEVDGGEAAWWLVALVPPEAP